jgi:hypothetical protein
MANVTGKALRDFKFQGKLIQKGDTVSMAPHAAATYSNIDYIKLDSAATEKVEAFTESKVDEAGTSDVREEVPVKRTSKKGAARK